MSAGAEGAAAQSLDQIDWQAPDQQDWAPPAEEQLDLQDEGREPRSRGRPVLAGLLILLTIGWFVACGLVLYETWETATLPNLVNWIAIASVPPVLIGLIWLIFGRTRRAETEKFTRAVALMRRETESLDIVLGIVAERLASNRELLSDEAGRLMKLGEEASDRLGRVTHYLSREACDLDRKSQAVENAAAQARVDIGVLLADLPMAEQSARSFSETLREAGVSAHERARALEAQLSAIAARAHDADAATGGAAERLSAHIARIESSAGVASQQLEGTAIRLDAAVDAALGRTTEAVEATRSALDAQAEGLLASVEQSRARFTEAGADASRQLSERLETARSAFDEQAREMFASVEQSRAHFVEAGADANRQLMERLQAARELVDTISAGIATQEEASQKLVAGLAGQIASLDERLMVLGQRTDSQSTQMASALAGLRDSTATLRQEVDASTQEAVALIGRTNDMAGALDHVRERLSSELPPVLSEVEARAAAMRDTAFAAIEPVQAVQAAAADGAARLADTEQLIERSRVTLETLLAGIGEGVSGIEQRLRELSAAANEADDAASLVVRETGPELVEALVRVREAARAAAGHAREAISAVIPESAANLSHAAAQAMDATVTEAVRQQIADLEATSQRAATAARKASERLTRQMLTLGESAAALEGRIEEERALRDEQERGGMSRRVALLIESLNSTAIDVTKILSNDVTDSAWQAYLKGDRGVFTRRAVRLLESGEAREIAQHYDEEPEFREQVNRYIHDFENMLRRVLADREGDTLSVTLLSSDMGKLYVALAQAIERLRK